MRHNKKLLILSFLAIILCVLFVVIGLNSNNLSYALSRRIPKVIAIVLTGASIAFSSVIFQTISQNHILTPSVIGLDSLYMLIQTIIVFLFGSSNLFLTDKKLNFFLSLITMLCFTGILYKFLFKKGSKNIFFLLLVGLVFGTLFESLTSFMQVVIDPNEFQTLQNKMFASFNNVNTNVLFISLIIVILVFVYVYEHLDTLDVMLLGRENSINLGVDYDNIVKKMLICVAILVSVATALVGPITFLGLLVVNIARQILTTYKHKYLFNASILISIIALIGGQLIVERYMNFGTTVSVIINFVGGIYFIYLLLKERSL
ncbi:iron chelate uptake ABC transporter family permease subunit [Clostridium botulinum]|uniref:iron chelate uptake ABC transporter family permease subunit n=1 Tax=Clostridium botulinum TaxID=1491 RepID=UPI000773D642|nr:iron chelate uptake ABC transporter family permease subunit [Clostridium botulinum]MBY6931481.1 iron chelate uptake ABC transporter family permease subunit [Clostridium botulinum]NFG22130.1 iron ABC transporter permease [Clostridium botulinum]NFO80586.1 iron ABC transporter permease [Clostridium botulinum]